MSDTKVFIHVGMHKTGTTFLQEEVFPNISGINYQRKIDLTTKVEPGKINLFSDENLDGGSYRLFANPKDRYTIAYNLRQMFPTAKIIICIRDKDEWIQSAYKQYTLSYFGYTFLEYFRRMNKETLDFTTYAVYLQNLFGRDNVLVLNYQDLKNDPHAFVELICDFIGVEVPMYEVKTTYPSLDDGQVAIIVLFDKIFKSKLLHLMLSLAVRLVRNDPSIQKWRNKKL